MSPAAATKTRTRKAKEQSVPDVLVGFVRDASVSMTGQTAATRAGFAEFVAEQAATPGGRLSLIDFGSDVAVRCVASPFEQVEPESVHYDATGPSTALYDATGAMIEGLDAWISAHPDQAVRPIVVVWTDGGENSSRRWTLERLNAAMGERVAAGWEFIFLGSGGSAWLEGRTSFAQHTVASNFVQMDSSERATEASYKGLSSTMTAARCSATPMAANNLAGAYADARCASGTVAPTSPGLVPTVSTSTGSTYDEATSSLAGTDDTE